MLKKRIKISNLESEEERFRKGLSKCRNCTHVRMAHSFLGLFQNVGKCMDATLIATGEYKQCSCDVFEPQDNLEFLEYKYDKKKLRKKK